MVIKPKKLYCYIFLSASLESLISRDIFIKMFNHKATKLSERSSKGFLLIRTPLKTVEF